MPRRLFALLLSVVLSAAVFAGPSLQPSTVAETLSAPEGNLQKEAITLWQQGHYQEAEQLCKRALSQQHLNDSSKTEQYVSWLNCMGLIYQAKRCYKEAESVYKEALNIKELTLGRKDPSYASCLKNLANLYQEQYKLYEAKALIKQVISIYELTVGKQHLDYITSIESLATLYQLDRQYSQAENLFNDALSLYEVTQGKQHSDYAACLRKLANLYQKQKEYFQAESHIKQALAIYMSSVGKHHPDYAACLKELADLYQLQNHYAQPEQLYQQALSLTKTSQGKQHLSLLTSLARLYQTEKRFYLAEPLLKKALSITEASLGKQNPDYIHSLHNLANFYKDQERYNLAKTLLKEALSITEASFGKQHPLYADSIFNLAECNYKQRRYDQAEILFKETLAIYKVTIGRQHPNYARLLNNLDKESIYKEEVYDTKASLGTEHPDYALSLNNLATFYYSQQSYDLAEPLYREVLAITSVTLGKQHPSYQDSLKDLARLYLIERQENQAELVIQEIRNEIEATTNKQELASWIATLIDIARFCITEVDREQKAEALLKEVTYIVEASLGKQHRQYSISLVSLADLFMKQERYDLAETLLNEALYCIKAASNKQKFNYDYVYCLYTLADLHHEIYLQNQNPDHLNHAISLYEEGLTLLNIRISKNNITYISYLQKLIDFYTDINRYEKVELLLREKLLIGETIYGKQSEFYINCLDNLARIYKEQSKFSDAWVAFNEARSISFDNIMDKVKTNFSDDSITNNLNGWDTGFSAFVAFELPSKYHPFAFNWILRTKAIEVDVMSNFIKSIYEQHSKSANYIMISKMYEVSAHLDKARRFGTDEDIQELEVQLNELQHEFRENYAKQNRTPLLNKQILYQELQPILRKHQAVYVDFVSASDETCGDFDSADRTFYVAYILTPSGPPTQVFLGIERGLGSAIDEYQNAFSYGQYLRSIQANQNTATALTKQQAIATYQKQAHKIYDLIMKPLQPYLSNTKHLYLSPDSTLSQIPFEALLTPKGQYLGQSLDIVYLTSGRDLLKLSSSKNKARSPQSIRIFSGPNYNLSPDTYKRLLASINSTSQSRSSSQLLTVNYNKDVDIIRQDLSPNALTSLQFSSLKGASKEGAQLFSTLSSLLPTLSKQDTFFQDDHALEDWLKGTSPPDILHLATHGFSVPNDQEKNPLLRSGLALAGANTLPKEPNALNDGILYAQEAALLNLKGTDLVVLSACETAKGEARPGEGVYNLNRAFLYAGANTVISSLHSVHDEATQKLMALFYENLLAKKMTKLQALQEAKKTMQQDPDFSHPFFWASFILVGNPN